MRFTTQTVLFLWRAGVGYRTYVNAFGFGGFGIDSYLDRLNHHWSRLPRNDFPIEWEYFQDTAFDEQRPK